MHTWAIKAQYLNDHIVLHCHSFNTVGHQQGDFSWFTSVNWLLLTIIYCSASEIAINCAFYAAMQILATDTIASKTLELCGEVMSTQPAGNNALEMLVLTDAVPRCLFKGTIELVFDQLRCNFYSIGIIPWHMQQQWKSCCKVWDLSLGHLSLT